MIRCIATADEFTLYEFQYPLNVTLKKSNGWNHQSIEDLLSILSKDQSLGLAFLKEGGK